MAPRDNLHSTAWSTSTYLLSRDVHTQLLLDSPHPPTSLDHHNYFCASFSHSLSQVDFTRGHVYT